MKIEELRKELETDTAEYHGVCHDCGCEVVVNAKVDKEGAITIRGGAVYKIKINRENRYFLKCDKCFEQDKTLRNWQNCEIFSRVVGYLRPISQYNIGKKEEYKMRKEFTNTKGT
jgi:hypothetical protein